MTSTKTSAVWRLGAQERGILEIGHLIGTGHLFLFHINLQECQNSYYIMNNT